MPKISAYIIAYNDEPNIEEAVKSVLWADEVVLVDSFSTDRTAAIASELGARVVQIPFEGFGKLRTSAIAATRYEWIFSLDSDERCTEAARQEMLQIVGGYDSADAYFVPRKNRFMGHWIRHCGWYPDYRQPQLFRRDALVFSEDMVHETFTINGRSGHLVNFIHQEPYRDLSHMCRKLERYSTLGAEKVRLRGESSTMWKALAHGTAAFLRIYFVKCGFLDGWPGFVIAFGNFEHTFYKYAKRAEQVRCENALKKEL